MSNLSNLSNNPNYYYESYPSNNSVIFNPEQEAVQDQRLTNRSHARERRLRLRRERRKLVKLDETNLKKVPEEYSRHYTFELTSSVIDIGEDAFKNSSIESMYVSNKNSSLKKIGKRAFYKTPLAKFRFFPPSLISIEKEAFCGTSIGTLYMHHALNLKSIGVNCFKKCKRLRGQIVLPETLEELGEGAFRDCWNIDSVTIFPGVKKVNKITFADCDNLKIVYFTTGTNIINQPLELDDSCFRNCLSLETVVFRRRVTKISKNSFHGCTNLKNIIFHEPPGFTELPFSTNPNKQPSLKKIVVPEGFQFARLPRDCLDLVVNEGDNSNVSLKNNFFNNNIEESTNTDVRPENNYNNMEDSYNTDVGPGHHDYPPHLRNRPPGNRRGRYRGNRGGMGRRRRRPASFSSDPDPHSVENTDSSRQDEPEQEPIVTGTKKTKNKKKQRSLKKKQNKFKKKKNPSKKKTN